MRFEPDLIERRVTPVAAARECLSTIEKRLARVQRSGPEVLVRIVKSSTDEERTVTGVVLVPDQVDAQGDKVSEEVIYKAALDYGSRLNKGRDFKSATKTGVQHESFDESDDVRVVFSWIAPIDIPAGVIGDQEIKKGSWIVTAKVFSDKVWTKVKKGTLTGWSIGGKSKARRTPMGVKVAKEAEKKGIPYYRAAVSAVRSAKSASQD